MSAGPFPDAGPYVCPLPQANVSCAAMQPDRANAVCRTLVPDLPRVWLDGGIPGPCEEITSPGTPYEQRSVMRYDAEGHLISNIVLDVKGGVISSATYHYDPCGRLVFSEEASAVRQQDTRVENDYRADGLLERTVTETPYGCQQQTFAYPPGDAGEVGGVVVDGVTCAPLHEFRYGPDGRVSQVTNHPTPSSSVTTDLFTYLPDGGVSSFTEDGYGTFGNVWDDVGVMIAKSSVFPNNEGGDNETWTYGAAHRLLEDVMHSLSRGPCGLESMDVTYSYDDAGVLRSADDYETVDPCPYRAAHLPILYDYPSPGVQVERHLDVDGGLLSALRTTVDARGNALSIESRTGPDAGWQTSVLRNYDCFVH